MKKKEKKSFWPIRKMELKVGGNCTKKRKNSFFYKYNLSAILDVC